LEVRQGRAGTHGVFASAADGPHYMGRQRAPCMAVRLSRPGPG
jgi:hypothetical protein